MAITLNTITAALESERAISKKGVALQVSAAEREDSYLVVAVKHVPGRSRIALDDGLEGVRVKWGDEFEFGGVIKFVDPDRDRIIIEPLTFDVPSPGTTMWLFPSEFLAPLIDLWNGPIGRRAGKRLRQSKEDLEPLQEIEPLPDEFSDLRTRQAVAVQNSAYRCSLLIGPPGTGKSYTIGALVSHLLTRHRDTRLLVVGPTNVAVDTAILAIDDWLLRLGRQNLASQMKRIGAHFDPRKYVDRPHLLAEGIAEKASEYLLLEMSEPPKNRVGDYVRWKDRMAAARTALAADIESTAASARVVGVTVSTAVRWQASLSQTTFPFVICDEASQIIGPAALMVAAMGEQVVFAGDPQQLAPIVRSEEKAAGPVLKMTAFDIFKHVKTTRLNEQSRMAMGICNAVGAIFYDNDLMVCRKASKDPQWLRHRSPYFVDGREVPRICFDKVDEPATFSAKYGGFIRFTSADLIKQIADQLAGSYVDAGEILVLTPFRAQRALIRSMLRRQHAEISVSTVHRAQGSERSVVIFDPVDGSLPFLAGTDGDRLINVALSRAKTHVIVPYHEQDLSNSTLASIQRLSSKLWQVKGDYSKPFSFRPRV